MTHEETISTLRKNGAEFSKNHIILSAEEVQWFGDDEPKILVKIDKPIETSYFDYRCGEEKIGFTQKFRVDCYSIRSSLEQNVETSWLAPMILGNLHWLTPLLSHATVSIIRQTVRTGECLTCFDCSQEQYADKDTVINMITSIELSDFGRKINEKLLDEFLHK